MGIHYGQLDLDERIESWRRHNAGTAPSGIARIMGRHPGRSARTQAQQFTEGCLQAGPGGPDGVLAPSSKLTDRAPEPAKGSYRRPPCDGLVARAGRQQAQAGGIRVQGQP